MYLSDLTPPNSIEGVQLMNKCLISRVTLGCVLLLGAPVFAKEGKQAPTSRPVARAKAKEAKKPKKASTGLKRLLKYKKVMREEMKRHWAFMRKRKGPKPFYMVYAMQQSKRVSLIARDGVVWRVSNAKHKPKYSLTARLRVGNHKFDNTGRDGYDYRAYRHMLPRPYYLPPVPDADSLRKYLWQYTDRLFKMGMASYHRKKYVRSLKVEIKDKSGDFSKEKPVKLHQPIPTFKLDIAKWKKILKRVSAFSRKDKRIISSAVSIAGSQKVRVFIDTDGADIIKQKTLYMYTVSITYLSPKREYLSNTRLAYYDTPDQLPNEKALKQAIKLTLDELINQGNAEEGKPEDAPAILEPAVAGVLFHEALGHRLEAQRMLKESDGRTFRRKLGTKVIPSFLSVYDDPSLKRWQGKPLNGHYLVDDQGVRGQRVTLFLDGILKGFLMSRKPIDKLLHSNGHGRGIFGRTPFSRMGNLLVTSKRKFSPAKLRKMLMAEARRQGKPYGYILSRSSGGYTHTGTYGIQSFKNRPIVIYKVDAKTGKQTLVKGLEMIGTPLTVVNNIMATGTDYGIFNGFCGAESGYVPVSAIAPSVLLKTVEMQRVKISQKKDFLLHAPFDHKHHNKAKKPAKKAAKTAKKKAKKAPTPRRQAPKKRPKARKAAIRPKPVK